MLQYLDSALTQVTLDDGWGTALGGAKKTDCLDDGTDQPRQEAHAWSQVEGKPPDLGTLEKCFVQSGSLKDMDINMVRIKTTRAA